MININLNELTDLEVKIHNAISQNAKTNGDLRITDAAKLCECSTSKISKFVRKLGFKNYRQYMQFVNGEDVFPPSSPAEDEFQRIRAFMDNFDYEIVEYFKELINEYERIVLLGYGPTYNALLYFEYKLRFAAKKNVFAVQENQMAKTLLTKDTLLLCFSVTGKFRDFTDVYREAEKIGGYQVAVFEEYNPDVVEYYDNVVFLTDTTQNKSWKPYEKSRILFFLLIEEITRSIITDKYQQLETEESNETNSSSEDT